MKAWCVFNPRTAFVVAPNWMQERSPWVDALDVASWERPMQQQAKEPVSWEGSGWCWTRLATLTDLAVATSLPQCH